MLFWIVAVLSVMGALALVWGLCFCHDLQL
jgi:hypothetical protein